jgi:hypothetical protein
MSVQDQPISPAPLLGGYTQWGPLGPGGDPAMSLQGYLNPNGKPLPAGVHLVAPMVPVLQLVREQWFPSQNPLVTAGLGQATDANPLLAPYLLMAFTSSVLGAFLGAYHGKKRSGGKAGSMWGWGLSGFFWPLPVVAIASVQGFGKRK